MHFLPFHHPRAVQRVQQVRVVPTSCPEPQVPGVSPSPFQTGMFYPGPWSCSQPGVCWWVQAQCQTLGETQGALAVTASTRQGVCGGSALDVTILQAPSPTEPLADVAAGDCRAVRCRKPVFQNHGKGKKGSRWDLGEGASSRPQDPAGGQQCWEECTSCRAHPAWSVDQG